MGRRRKRAVFPPWAVFLPPSLGCFSSLPPWAVFPPSLPGLFFLPPSPF